ncbi:T9SS-dependent choice-of-anchor J family protein [Flavobacterium sp.]|uniref:T9SS-dependent choice-of-anchor J family protein n=1 Tax=Flavobacterium sp. TaxID=239 RepID=UPI00286BFFA3|nr:choice-of-anchor J domain-containing protein [Flavobacterium sp.]
MKKLYLTLIIFLTLQANAQFFEGFEGAIFPPAGWVTANSGLGTLPWKRMIVPWTPYEGSGGAFIDRQNTGPGISGCWLITPAITITANTPLTFFSRQSIMGNDATAIYQIRISTTSQTDLSSFTVLNAWSETDLNLGLDYESKIVSLNAYAGQTVYIAFVRIINQPTLAVSGDRWLLDNVSIGSTNLINGNVQFSMDGSCGITSTPLYDNINIQAQYNTNVDNVFTNVDGHYTYTTLQNNFTLTPNLSIGSYFNITPANYNFNFPDIGSSGTANFCITPNGIHPDLEITLLPRISPVSGFYTIYDIAYKNKGNQIQSGTIALSFNDAIMDYGESYPTIDAQSPGILTWNFTDLKPFESRTIEYVKLNLNSPTDTPPVNAGDVINLTANITAPQTDETPSDNTSSLSQIVVVSLDPNDKIVTEGSVIDISKVGEFLHYMIRFQNIGTADATNVVVRDILTDNLDASTFEMIATSHPCSTLKRGNQLEFAFDNIHLPSSTIDEPASHGFVAFKIKPAATVGVGSIIQNTASIYFDFNFPIVTNTTSTAVATLGTQSFDEKHFKLYPNPAKNIVTVNVNDAITIQSITIYNPLGQMVKTIPLSALSSSITVDVSQLKAGTYFMEITSNQGKTTKKFVKL